MSAVAKRFVGAFAATAKSDPIANFIGCAIRRFNGYAASYPDGPHFPGLRIFNQADRRFEIRFNSLSILIPGYQPSGWAITGFLDRHLPGSRVVGSFRKLPSSPGAVAETGANTEILSIGKLETGTVYFTGLFQIGFMAGSFGPIEAYLHVPSIAERIFLGMAAAAESIAFLGRVFFAFFPSMTLSISINTDALL